MEFSLAQVREAIRAQVVTSIEDCSWDLLSSARILGWSIDSRTVSRGELFFAIKGEHFDGHGFVRAALEAGAVAAVVDEPVANGVLLKVPDTLVALQQLAHWARRCWGRPIVAVTGSAGKTSTKDIIAEMLGVRFRVGKTAGNFNNHIGVPLSLLRIPDDAEVAVVEMGMNHAGEIRALADIAEPELGVVTNVGYAHIEGFDSIEGIAAAKRELIEKLPPSGIAVLNADDERVMKFREAHGGRTITYGFSAHADFRATEVKITAEGSCFNVQGVSFRTGLNGRHGVANVLAGIAVASVFDIAPQELVDVVAQLVPGKMRGERSEWQGVTILDDSYNSNPEAVRSMIDILRNEPARRKIAVLGEMLELGQMAEILHREVGRYAARAGVDILIGVSGAAHFLIDEASRAGMADSNALFFDEAENAGDFLRHIVKPGDAVLFKGSRGTRVEVALARMKA